MTIKEITKSIDKILAEDIVNQGFEKKYIKGSDGRYEWHFDKENMDICLMETFKEYINVTFSLFHTTISLSAKMKKFIPMNGIEEMMYGLKFNNEQELEEVLLRLKCMILNDGMQWMESNYEKYRRTN